MKQSWKRFFFFFALLYAIALALYLVGTFGAFGSPRGPLAGVFLVPLGMPWNFLVDYLPQSLWPYAAALTPVLNLVVIWLLGRRAARA